VKGGGSEGKGKGGKAHPVHPQFTFLAMSMSSINVYC